ncbi:MAG: hypothetical protein CO118_09230 [Flavobacteriales bacterium CG_4_9_14_3_um_filter_32_8]|nr:MAG: hypothetical protein CO118_09230 [Flavobacteriales bacterium CG_4_9_14_3_um_filter_32_8]
MKKNYKMATFACLGLLLSTQNSNAQTASFENLTLPAESYWDGSDLSGTHNNGTFYSEFVTGDFTFPNVFDTTFGMPGYWLEGFAYSNKTDSVTSGFGNLYSARAGSGANGTTNYAVSTNNSYLKINNTGGYNFLQIGITNSAYAYYSMKDGDAFAKKFGGASGNDPDWFKVTIKAYSNGNYQDSTDFFLADFRFGNNAQDYILKDWGYAGITTSNPIDSVYFELSSSDNGTWGMNTPAFFALDELELNTVGIAETNLINFKLYPNPAATFLNIKNTAIIESVIISDINGRLVKNSFTNTKEIKIDVADLKAGVYFIQVFSKGIPQTQKFIKE